MMLGTNNAMAVDLPRAPKSFSKAARSPRQASSVVTSHGGGAPKSARRPATGGMRTPAAAPSGGSLSARSASAGPKRQGGASLRLSVRDLPKVSHEDAATADGGALVKAALAEHRLQYMRDGDGFKQEAAASADKQRHGSHHHGATHKPADDDDGGTFGLGSREDRGDRDRGLTSSPRLPDSALLDGVVRDHLNAKCKAFAAAVNLDDGFDDGASSADPIPSARQSPAAMQASAVGKGQPQQGRDKTMAERCAAVREIWVDARRTASEFADVYAGGERDDGASPTTGGTITPPTASAPPVVPTSTKNMSATQRAYYEVTQQGLRRGGTSPRSPLSNHSDDDAGDGSGQGSPLQIAGLTFEQAEELQYSARERIREKRLARDDVVPSARLAPHNTQSCSFASGTTRFTQEVSRNPPVGQYNPRLHGIERHVRTAVIARRPKTGPGSPTNGSPLQSPRSTGAPSPRKMPEPAAAAAAAPVPPLDAQNLQQQAPPATARIESESPRARAQAAAREQQPKAPAPTWPFASKSLPPPPRQSVCRDHVRAMPNEAALSTATSPRAHVQFSRSVGREAPVSSHSAHGPSCAPLSVPNPPPGMADRCAAPAPKRAKGTGGDFRSHRNAATAAATGTIDGDDFRSAQARGNADAAIARAGAVAVHGQGAAGFVDFARQNDRSRPAGNKLLNEAGGRSGGATGPDGKNDATTIDMVDVAALTQPRPAGLVDFRKQTARPPLYDVMVYQTTEHASIPEAPAKHLQDIDFGKLGPHPSKPIVSDCAAEFYDADHAATIHRTRAATLGRQTAPQQRPTPTDRVDHEFSATYGQVARRAKLNPASGTTPSTAFTKRNHPSSEGADLMRSLNATRRRRGDRAPALAKQLGHVHALARLTEVAPVEPERLDPPVVHQRTRGDPMIAKHVDRETRNRRLEPPAVVPLSQEEATVLLGVKKAAALQAERADPAAMARYTCRGESLTSTRTRADFAHTTSRETLPHDRLAVHVTKKDNVPGPGSYEV